MNLTIRNWNFADANSIALLNLQWGYPSTPEEINERLQELSNSADNDLFIAEINGTVVGWLHVYQHFSMGTEAFAEVGGLVVDQASRQKGVGKALMEKAKEWAKKNGLTRLLVRTNVKRKEANIFYAKCGFNSIKQQNVFEFGVLPGLTF